MLAAVSFIFFTALVAVVSYYMTRGDNLETQDGYFLGGRSLTGIIIGGSLMLTNLSTEQLVGLNGQGYRYSMVVMAWEVGAAIALVFMALVFLPKYLKSGITTIPDFLEKRYDAATRQIVTVLFLIAYIVTQLPTVLYSGSLVLTGLFDVPGLLNVSQFSAITITIWAIGIIGSLYAIFGGLKAVAVSDTLNGIGLVIGGFSIPIFGLMKLGDGSFAQGINTLVQNHPEKLNSIGSPTDPVPFAVLFAGMLFNNLFYWCTNQSIVQRTFAAKNLAEGQKGVIMAGFLKLLGPMYLVMPGIIAFHLYPNLSNGDLAYPLLINDVLPKPLTGFMGAVLFGAILSSFNSILNSTVTLFCINVYRPIFKPEISDLELVTFGKKIGTFVAVASMLIAPFIMYAPSGLFSFLMEMWGFFNVPILSIIIIGFFTKRTSAFAAKLGVVAHLVIYSSYKMSDLTVNFLHILGISLPITVLTILLISHFKPREVAYEQEYTKQVEITPWKHVKTACSIILVLVVGVYLLFSKYGIAAA